MKSLFLCTAIRCIGPVKWPFARKLASPASPGVPRGPQSANLAFCHVLDHLLSSFWMSCTIVIFVATTMLVCIRTVVLRCTGLMGTRLRILVLQEVVLEASVVLLVWWAKYQDLWSNQVIPNLRRLDKRFTLRMPEWLLGVVLSLLFQFKVAYFFSWLSVILCFLSFLSCFWLMKLSLYLGLGAE